MNTPKDFAAEFPVEEVLSTSDRTVVYRSRDPQTGTPVAVKILNTGQFAGDDELRQQYLRLIEAVKSVALGGLPRILAAGFADDGNAFMVMKFDQGIPITRSSGMSLQRRLMLLDRVANTVDVASRCGIHHLNLRPQNIMIVGGSDSEEIRLTGLGTGLFFSLSDSEPESDVTPRERFVPPERRSGERSHAIDSGRADLYQLAMTIAELLGAEVSNAGGGRPTVSLPKEAIPQLADPDRLTQALEKALRSDPGERTIDVASVRRALKWRSVSPPPSAAAESKVKADETVLMPLEELDLPGLKGPSKSTEPLEVKRPPRAVDDRFDIDEGAILKVAAPGVLGNDSDPEGNPLTATVVETPKHGILGLEKDGSFSYAPDSGFQGVDTFTYRANNGFQDSDVATVTIDVRELEKSDPTTAVPQAPEAPGPSEPATQPAPDASREERPPAPITPPPVPTPSRSTITPPPVKSPSAHPPPEPPPIEPPPVTKPPRQDVAVEPPPVEPPPLEPHLEEPTSVSVRVADILELFPLRQWLILAGIVAGVILLVVVLVVVWPDPTAELEPEPAPTVPAPSPVPTATRVPTEAAVAVFHPRLDAAEAALLSGDRGRAASELEALTDEDITSFSEEEAGLYDHLQASIEGGRRDQAVADLRNGLAAGNMATIRRALVGLSGIDREEVAAVPDLARDLQRGQEALRVFDAMQRARRDEDPARVLEHAAAMRAVLPNAGITRQWREEAAVSLESTADGLASNGQYLRAIAEIEPLVRWWPDRDGLEQRLEGYRALQKNAVDRQAEEEAFESFLESARQRGRDGAPEEGLRMLERRDPPPGLEERKAAVVTALEARLDELDAEPPTLALSQDADFDYIKNQSFTIACRIGDDYRVVSARAMVRVKDASDYRELPMTGPVNGLYYLEVRPEVHGNGPVEVYFEARDTGGRVGSLGSPSQPLVFQRKGFFKKLVGD